DAVQRREVVEGLFQDQVGALHGIFGGAQQIVDLAPCRIVPDHEVLDVLRNPVTVDRPTEDVAAIALLIGRRHATDGSLYSAPIVVAGRTRIGSRKFSNSLFVG